MGDPILINCPILLFALNWRTRKTPRKFSRFGCFEISFPTPRAHCWWILTVIRCFWGAHENFRLWKKIVSFSCLRDSLMPSGVPIIEIIICYHLKMKRWVHGMIMFLHFHQARWFLEAYVIDDFPAINSSKMPNLKFPIAVLLSLFTLIFFTFEFIVDPGSW